MATAKPAPDPRTPAKAARRSWPWMVAALFAVMLAWFWQPLKGYAETGASYGARVVCSCRYLGGRPLDDCRKDFEPGMELVMLSEDAQAKSVTARFPLLASETAVLHPGEGCRLEPWSK